MGMVLRDKYLFQHVLYAFYFTTIGIGSLLYKLPVLPGLWNAVCFYTELGETRGNISLKAT